MPWELQAAGNGKYYVVDNTGKRYSKEPLPKWRALQQLKVLWSKAKEVSFKLNPMHDPKTGQFAPHSGVESAPAGSLGSNTIGADFSKEPAVKDNYDYVTSQVTGTAGMMEGQTGPPTGPTRAGRAIYEYTSLDYVKLNTRLREEGKMNPNQRDMVERLDFSMSKAPRLGGDVTVYRGIKGEHDFKVGDSFADKAFVSTSAKVGVAQHFGSTVMQVNLKKGQKALAIGGNSSAGGAEAEILLPRGSKFKVTAVKTVGKQSIVELEVMGE